MHGQVKVDVGVSTCVLCLVYALRILIKMCEGGVIFVLLDLVVNLLVAR